MTGTPILLRALERVLGDRELFGVDGACPATFEPGSVDGRVLLISGDNAGGKSLLCRQLGTHMRALAAEDGRRDYEFMHLGMQMRSQGGIVRSVVFGDESSNSTGRNTVSSILGAIRTSRERESAHTVCLDEPDIGLSEGYQGAVGDALADYLATMPGKADGLVVVTHSRPIARHLLPFNPHLVRVGDDLRPTGEWMRDGALPRTVADLEGLRDRARTRFRAVLAIQETRTAKRRVERGF